MNMNDYSTQALVTLNDLGREGNLIHAALLLTSEAGEVADALKKSVVYGKEVDKVNLLEEAGDLIYGINLLLYSIGYSWDDALEGNIAKLKARYPNGVFEAGRAIHRDKQTEMKALADSLGG